MSISQETRQILHSFESMPRERKLKALEELKGVLREGNAAELIDSPWLREQMASMGYWLGQHEMYDDAAFVLRNLIDDPDPSFPSSLHKDIEAGERENIITTVRGQVAWAAMTLLASEKYFRFAVESSFQLLRDDDLYVQSQALIAISEFAQRRQKLLEDDPEYYSSLRSELLEYLDKNSKYPSIKDALVHVFSNLRDLDTEQSLKVISQLKGANHSGFLYMYYCIFRKNHFKDNSPFGRIEFDADRLTTVFSETVNSDDPDELQLQEEIVWYFWDSTNGHDTLEHLKSSIYLYLEKQRSDYIYYFIGKIILQHVSIEKYKKDCLKWLERIFALLALRENPGPGGPFFFLLETTELLDTAKKEMSQKRFQELDAQIQDLKRRDIIRLP